MTPLHCSNEDKPSSQNEPLKTYVEIIREVAEYYSLPVLDMYENSGIQPNFPANSLAYTVDGLHPNDAGYELISELVLKFLKSL